MNYFVQVSHVEEENAIVELDKVEVLLVDGLLQIGQSFNDQILAEVEVDEPRPLEWALKVLLIDFCEFAKGEIDARFVRARRANRIDLVIMGHHVASLGHFVLRILP